MIRSKSKTDHSVERSSHSLLILLLILTSTILVSSLPGSASASANMSEARMTGHANLLLFDMSYLNKPLK